MEVEKCKELTLNQYWQLTGELKIYNDGLNKHLYSLHRHENNNNVQEMRGFQTTSRLLNTTYSVTSILTLLTKNDYLPHKYFR